MTQSAASGGGPLGAPGGDARPRRRMNVAHVLAGGRFGGLESVVRMLTSGLHARGHTVHVVLLADPDDESPTLAETLAAAGATVHVLRHGLRDLFRERRALRERLARIGSEVVHTHGYRADIQGPPAARALGLPVVSTLHGFTGGGAKIRAYELIQLLSLRRHDLLVAVSQPIADRLRRAGLRPARIRVLRNAWTAPAPLRPRGEARATLGVAAEARVVGWVGRLSAEKAPDVLLEAARRIGRRDVTFCFVGDGPLHASLAAEVERSADLKGRVIFAGAHPDAGRLFSAFDVLALSSRTEGTPIVLFEAMAAGVPIVATHVGGVPDVLDERSARLVPPDTPDALATAIDAALADGPDATARTEGARHLLAERFAFDPWLRAYEGLYEALLTS